MRDISEIRFLLDELEHQPADALEGQDLDPKELYELHFLGSMYPGMYIFALWIIF